MEIEYNVIKWKVAESDIPLEVLYNPHVEKIKREDHLTKYKNVRALVFNYRYDEDGKTRKGVKLEVLGEEEK